MIELNCMHPRIKLLFFIFLLISLRGLAQKDTISIFYFPVNSHQLDSGQIAKLAELTLHINRIDAITGYADTTGGLIFNRHLSQLRADEVLRIMKNINVELRAHPEGKGETGDNPDLGKNRKVEVIASLKPRAIPNEPARTHDSTITTLSIDNIFFIPDQPEIDAGSYQAVMDLAGTLKKYKGASFEIIGHVNYQSRRDSSHLRDLYKLSELRAKRIYDLLISEGIPSSRMSYKGVGNSQPLISNPKNDEERKKNMRVQIRIVE